MTKKTLTKTEATAAARDFVRDYITGTKFQAGLGDWDTDTLARYLPRGFRLRADAEFFDAPTIGHVAEFLHRNAVAE